MNRLPMSAACSGLLRALIARCAVGRDRILLTEFRSTDWQSLTFSGERHEFRLRIAGPGAESIAARLGDGLEDAEFTIPGQIVADVRIEGPIELASDGSVSLSVEALTIEE